MRQTLALTLALLLILPVPIHAQAPSEGAPWTQAQAITFQTLTVSTAAVGLSAATYNPADNKGTVQRCVGTVETQPIRHRAAPNSSGVATPPTATVGRYAPVGTVIVLEGYRVIVAWRAIRDTGASADATINFECYRVYKA